MKLVKLTVMAGLMSLASAGAFAQNEAVDLLRKMEARFKEVKSVSGSFTQTLTDPTFKVKTSTPATFQLLKPSYFKAEYQSRTSGQPPKIQLISDKTYYDYIPELNQVMIYEFKDESNVRDLNYLLLGFGAKADDVTKVYKVTPLKEGTGALLTPKNTQEANFKFIRMTVNPQTLQPISFSMEQLDGTPLSVELNQSSLQLNAPLSPDNFRPAWPKGPNGRGPDQRKM